MNGKVFLQFFRILNDSGTYIDSLRVELQYLTDQNVNETFENIENEIMEWRSNITNIIDHTITQSPLKDVLGYAYFWGNVSTRFVENDQKKIVDSLRTGVSSEQSISSVSDKEPIRFMYAVLSNV